MVPMSGTSCLITTLYSVKYAVGPNGKETGLTLENILSLELGSLDVVTINFGSSTPAHLYSSSMWELTPADKTTPINQNLEGTQRCQRKDNVAGCCSS
ncbi:hypothetical protein EYF80_003959 [Liparis tanakae]|uniref:Uncharacterized protein n=1 Tax=Liparis tanakae TaxID=230148 RepID=A0A4Z2J8D4_9TELE|nr:hypothetical protein EYF80_003959 [Liparis tanakae]